MLDVLVQYILSLHVVFIMPFCALYVFNKKFKMCMVCPVDVMI